MEIYLLGPLEVLQHGKDITPSAPKLRTVLSLLAVQANSVVRTDQIIDELWEDNPPASVNTTLQTYIYQLRKLLQLAVSPAVDGKCHASKPVELRTSPHGYALVLDPDLLDTTQFERLADQGRRELEAGRVEAASEILSLALQLWRGHPLIDVSHGPVLRAEIVRLEEMHKNALEQRIEADLQLGRHHELLGELTRLAAQQPTHEGFQAKLMLALYRAGRRSEALEIYRRTRSVLAMELGLDPSNELEHLHRAVLTADERLDIPQPRMTVRTNYPRPPRELPPDGPPLIGRQSHVEAALAALSAQQRHAPPVVVITGPPGSGKSALCVQVGHLANGPYPDGQLYARMLSADGRPAEPRDVLAEFLRALEVPDERIPATLSERCRLFRTCTAGVRVLVTLDDVVSTEQLQPLVPSNPACGVLATARRHLSAPGITTNIVVRPLSVEDGVRLLSGVLDETASPCDEGTVRDLVRLCDGLPAALHAAAARLKVRPHWRLSKLVTWLSTAAAHSVSSGQYSLGLHNSVQRTYRIVSPTVRTAFRMLTSLEVPAFSPQLAARVLDLPEPHAESLLDELTEFQLIEAEYDDDPSQLWYRFLAGVRAVGRQLPTEGTGIIPVQDSTSLPVHTLTYEDAIT